MEKVLDKMLDFLMPKDEATFWFRWMLCVGLPVALLVGAGTYFQVAALQKR